jgi:uncharacterized protein YicC (UPF0701 family)
MQQLYQKIHLPEDYISWVNFEYLQVSIQQPGRLKPVENKSKEKITLFEYERGNIRPRIKKTNLVKYCKREHKNNLY